MFLSYVSRRFVAGLCGWAVALPAFAQPAAATDPLWELGGFVAGVSQQAYPGAREQARRALALPFVVYRGPILRADRGALGLRALKTERLEFDIGFAASLGSNSDDIEARRGMPDLGTLVEFGPRATLKLGEPDAAGGRWAVELPLRGVFDLSDHLASRGLVFEPELAYARRGPGLRWRAGVGAVFGNRKLADTFYGVAPAFATADRSAYEAHAGLIAWRLAFSASQPLGRDWRLYGYARFDSVAGARNRDSPLVQRQTGHTVGLGLAWTWMRSQRPAVD